MRVERLYAAVADAAAGADVLAAELCGGATEGVGSGLLMVNPPFGIDAEVAPLLRGLGEAIGTGDGSRVEWLVRS